MKLSRMITTIIVALGFAGTAGSLAHASSDVGSANSAFNSAIAADNLGFTEVTATFVESDGKILVAGMVGNSPSKVVRLNADGTVDSSFVAPEFGTNQNNSRLVGVAANAGGDVFVAGYFPSVTIAGTTTPSHFLARFTPSGALDANYSSALEDSATGGLTHYVNVGASNANGMFLDSQDNVILAGGFYTNYHAPWNSVSVFPLMRINGMGSVDPSFAPGLIDASYNFGYAVIGGSNNSIIVTGSFGNGHPTIQKFDSTGALATGFTPASSLVYSLYGVAEGSDGKIYVGGVKDADTACLARLNSDGSLDSSFAPAAMVHAGAYPSVNWITMQSDHVIIGGSFDGFLKRFDLTGNEDSEFASNVSASGLNGFVDMTNIAKDGSLLVGGSISSPASMLASFKVSATPTPTPTDTSLADTGAAVNPWLMLVGLALIFLGLATAGTARRRA